MNNLESATSPRLPVTVLSGFLGARKTTLLNLDEVMAAADSDAWAALQNPFPELELAEEEVS